MSKKIIGLLVMDYGTPASLDDVKTYYTHIRRGNPPTPEKLKELKHRYAAIGGVSPLTERTRAQIIGLEQVLNEQIDHIQFKAYSGKKHVYPFITDAVKQMVEDGIEEAVGIVLAPHYSTMSVGAYNKYAHEAAEKFGLKKLTLVNQWHLDPEFIDALVSRMKEVLSKFPEVSNDEIKVLFTAHSLPKRILQMNDPYPEQLLETSRAIADKV
ncbi:MAG: ferrochelatase, partial [Bacilli bacterium]